jgi:4-hydroxy-3-polyprenylbenzoate decarboxylase
MKMTMVPEIIDMDMPVEGVFHNLVIAQIRKEYAGQGQKVMNAMWGAGQMMFNKILVIADEGIKIQQYEQLAQYIFKNLNPATDIYFSQGPMDVLDHSCSKLGFGGKMCIDGTLKHDEEKDETFDLKIEVSDFKFLQEVFSEITSINASLLKKEIPVLVIAVEKNRKGHIRELHQTICDRKEVEGIKLILYVEHTINAEDLGVALWRFCNNLDPKRDFHLVQRPSLIETERTFACMGLDGTRKTKEHDNFQRDWPNIIVADNATIQSVDEKWVQLNLGPFLSSPSLKFKHQMYGDEAVVQ